MELRILRYFLVLAQEMSFSGAASLLNMHQTTLSRHIKRLERDLRSRLFIRGGSRQVFLTPKGELLRERAREVVELADKGLIEYPFLSNKKAWDLLVNKKLVAE
jgi:DNA-binding transcriptional LysR family regulator